MSREQKPFNFDKWFNIWMIVILGLTLLSLAGNLVVMQFMGSYTERIGDEVLPPLDDPEADELREAFLNLALPNPYNKPSTIISLIIAHGIGGLFGVGAAYIVLKDIQKRSNT